MERPLVSVAIPLHRSERFLDRIVGNLEGIQVSNAEIIVSDRHGDDRLLDALRRRIGDDPRVEIRGGNDRSGWVDHYNRLLRESSGRYFLWMPHDDFYPAGYVSRLIECLEEDSDAILSYGTMEAVGEVRGRPFRPPPVDDAEPWTPEVAKRLLVHWNLGLAFRGVFRRDVVLEANHFIRPTRKSILADECWMFGLALLGPLPYVPTSYCVKYYYPSSEHAGWMYGVRTDVSMLATLWSYANDLSPEAEGLERSLLSWTSRKIVRRVKRRVLQGLLSTRGRLSGR